MAKSIPPSDKPFSWGDWTRPTTPFLCTPADIAQRLDIPLATVGNMHARGLLPPTIWSDPPLWQGQVIQPWITDTLREADRLGHALTVSKDENPVSAREVEETLTAFGLVGLRGLARQTGQHITTLRQWYREGCPNYPMPYPDLQATDLQTEVEEPYWFTDGHIQQWCSKINAEKPIPSGSKIGREQPNVPYGRKENRGVMGKIYDRFRRDFDTTLTAMVTEKMSLADLAKDFPRILNIAVRLDAPVKQLVPFADKLALAGMWSALEVDEDTLGNSTAAGAFSRGARGLCLARTGSIESAVADLAAALRSPSLPSGSLASDFLRFQKAYAELCSGFYSVAIAEFDAIAAEDGFCAGQARYWRANLAVNVESRFQDALAVVETVESGDLSDIFQHLLRGDIHRLSARFVDAEREYTRARDLARQVGATGLEGTMVTRLAETVVWTRPQEGRGLALDAIERAKKERNKLDEYRSWLALAIADTGAQSDQVVQDHIRKAVELNQLNGAKIGQLRIGTTEAFRAVVMGESDAFDKARKTVSSVTGMLGTNEFQNDVLTVWSGTSSVEQSRHSRETQWLDGPDEALHRWREVVIARQSTG